MHLSIGWHRDADLSVARSYVSLFGIASVTYVDKNLFVFYEFSIVIEEGLRMDCDSLSLIKIVCHSSMKHAIAFGVEVPKKAAFFSFLV